MTKKFLIISLIMGTLTPFRKNDLCINMNKMFFSKNEQKPISTNHSITILLHNNEIKIILLTDWLC